MNTMEPTINNLQLDLISQELSTLQQQQESSLEDHSPSLASDGCPESTRINPQSSSSIEGTNADPGDNQFQTFQQEGENMVTLADNN